MGVYLFYDAATGAGRWNSYLPAGTEPEVPSGEGLAVYALPDGTSLAGLDGASMDVTQTPPVYVPAT